MTVENTNGPVKEKKKRRTAEEIAEERLQYEEKQLELAEQNEKDADYYEKQIQELLKKKAEAQKTMKKTRRTVRNHVGIKTYGALVKVMNLKQQESKLNKLSEFEKLSQYIIETVKTLMKFAKDNNYKIEGFSFEPDAVEEKEEDTGNNR